MAVTLILDSLNFNADFDYISFKSKILSLKFGLSDLNPTNIDMLAHECVRLLTAGNPNLVCFCYPGKGS